MNNKFANGLTIKIFSNHSLQPIFLFPLKLLLGLRIQIINFNRQRFYLLIFPQFHLPHKVRNYQVNYRIGEYFLAKLINLPKRWNHPQQLLTLVQLLSVQTSQNTVHDRESVTIEGYLKLKGRQQTRLQSNDIIFSECLLALGDHSGYLRRVDLVHFAGNE